MNTRHYLALGACAVLVACNGTTDGRKYVPKLSPPVQPVTVEFGHSGFDAIRLGASFDYAIRQGGEFSVAVTIDPSYTDELDVRIDGDTLNVGFLPNSDIRSNTMEAIITMPDVSRLEISGSASGFVAGFSGNTLEVDISGNAVLDGSNLQFDYLWIRNDGSATVNFSDVAAITGADVQLGGSSISTINLMDFATVTGQMSGSSTLQYFGSNVNLQVAAHQSSRIVRLGGSQ